MTARPILANAAARALFLARHGLAAPPAGPAALAGLIHDLGFVQVDSVNTVARAHDLILWSRRQTYRPDALQRLFTRGRQVFEHWTHDAAVIPIDFYPHWHHRFAADRARLAERWTAWQGPTFRDQFDRVLRHVADNGACISSDLADDRPEKSTGWWDWHPSKAALEYLWRTGDLAVARREGFRKVYDLAERVIPDPLRLARPSPEATIDWAATAALDRLGFATSGEIAAFFDLITPDQAKAWCARALSRGELIEIEVECADGTRRRSLARPDLTEQPVPEPGPRLRVLSPFDPALRDRARAERLFGFHYRIEIFVPAARRRYGYYVFPILEGTRLIGRIDMKADRTASTPVLAVRALWPEAGQGWTRARQQRLEAELDRLTRLAGVEQVSFEKDWLRPAGRP